MPSELDPGMFSFSRNRRSSQVTERSRRSAAEGTLRFSDDFADPEKLLEAADRMLLEGIVSKRADQPYRSGKNPGWVKVKTKAWHAANGDRSRLFQKR
jgi:ATP-dependent DNA ligase